MDGLREVKYFPFFGSVKNPVTAPGVSGACFNNGFDLLVLEVSGATTIEAVVEGCINNIDADGNQLDEADCVYTELTIMDIGYNIVEKIEDNGIYYIGINGCSRVRVNATALTGSVKIVGALEK